MHSKNYILSIAGCDPSSGAGITSDIKTFEAHNLYGLSVCTAITVQNDIAFEASHWVDVEIIMQQIETLFDRFKIEVVKIGIIQNWKILHEIVKKLKQLNPEVKIILDPILKATAGMALNKNDNVDILDEILDGIFLITPNYDEIQNLYPELSIKETIEHISLKTNLYLKGGHRNNKKGWDQLFYNKNLEETIAPIFKTTYDKHGSGCVFSSSIASYIALEFPLGEAARHAKVYIENFLRSDQSLLGKHTNLIISK